MDNALTKTALLDTMNEEWANWERLLKQFGPQDVMQPGVEGYWSLKDVLAHVTYWQHQFADRLEYPLADPDWRSQPDNRSEDEINDEAYRESLPKSPEQIRAEFEASYRRLQAAIEALSGDDLSRRHPNPAADDATWPSKSPLWRQITGSALEHLQEHREAVQGWLNEHRDSLVTPG